MSDWDKLKVTELKEELKTRGVPLTGLKLKQQLIDKLIELESGNATEDVPAQEVTNGALEEVDKSTAIEGEEEHSKEVEATENQATKETSIDADAKSSEDGIPLPSDRPAALKEEDSQAEDMIAKDQPQTLQDIPMADNVEEAKEIEQHDVMIPEIEQLEPQHTIDTDARSLAQSDNASDNDGNVSDEARKELEKKLAQKEEPTKIIKLDTDMNTSIEIADEEGLEEQRKRKRRSATPPPVAEEIQKKAKGASGEAIVTKTVSSSAKLSHSHSRSPEPAPHSVPEDHVRRQIDDIAPRQTPSPGGHHSPVPSQELDTVPATHPATQSLYIRNFKRPLHIPTLRSYISSIAKAHPSITDEDPVKFFYLDSIRTHAFITFSNIAAASRVRNAIHGTRFPDEPQREPLWIDFIPNEKVQDWVDQESGGSGSGGGFGRGGTTRSKFEVVYDRNGDGEVRASLQEADSSNSQPHRPSFSGFANGGGRLKSFSQDQSQLYPAEASKVPPTAPGIHPDRAVFVPKSPALDRRPSQRLPPHSREDNPRMTRRERQEEDKTPAFHALSSLFSSTQAKPLLYFKLPSQSVIDERLKMIRDLYPDRGFSGEPGMKRYTFEQVRGQDEWVDNGPEFGHGKKGLDRLFGGPRGGFRGGRGGGNTRGRFGFGDSYRGGGAR